MSSLAEQEIIPYHFPISRRKEDLNQRCPKQRQISTVFFQPLKAGTALPVVVLGRGSSITIIPKVSVLVLQWLFLCSHRDNLILSHVLRSGAGIAVLALICCLHWSDAFQHSVVCSPRVWSRRLNLVDLVLGGHGRKLFAKIQVQAGQKKSKMDLLVKPWEENISKVRVRSRHVLMLCLLIDNF